MLVSEPWAVMDVEMKVLGRLIIAAVGGEAAASVLLGDAAAKVGGNGEHLVGDGQIAGFQSCEGRNMALRDDDDMNRPVWLRVVKGENLLCLGDALNGDTA